METRLFEISGKYQEDDGRWSKLEKDFVGYISLDTKTNILNGHMTEQYECVNSYKERFILGLFKEEDERDRIVFYKMSNNPSLDQYIYAFQDIKKEGDWFIYDPNFGLIRKNKAKIFLQEIEYNEEKYNDILKKYNESVENSLELNQYLINEKFIDLDCFFL